MKYTSRAALGINNATFTRTHISQHRAGAVLVHVLIFIRTLCMYESSGTRYIFGSQIARGAAQMFSYYDS